MSDTLAKYSFLPFVRLGLGNQITEQDTLGVSPYGTILERPEVQVSLNVKATAGVVEKNELVSRIVKIEGPGDVLGIQASQIIRVHPAKGVDNFEINNLVYIEFYEEDFPWRYTPASPLGNNLRPWIAVLVLKTDEFTRNTQGGTPTPLIRIRPEALQAVFYPQTDLHHFAHVHVLETLSDNISNAGTAANEINTTIAKNPDLALSRIICPRRLQADTEYHVFLVPSYETGRLAGMGQPTAKIVAQQPSWKRDTLGTNPMDMPYYHTWSFKTGAKGDFEELVMDLKVRTFPGNTGRDMDLSDPGYGIKPKDNDAIVLVEGAIQSQTHVTPPWPKDEQALQQKLKEILNLDHTLQSTLPSVPSGNFYSPNVMTDPIITPPIYGKWHAFTDKLTNKSDWVHQLNLHPSHRAAAGLGTRVIQEHQEEFMEMAWNQVGPINEANQRIIENEAVSRSAERLFRKNLKKMSQLALMNTLGNAMEVLKVGNQLTAKKRLKDSRVPTAFRSGTFLRIANNFTQTALMTSTGTDGLQDVMDESLLLRTDADEGTTISSTPGSNRASTAISAAPRRKAFEIQLDPIGIKNAISNIIQNPPASFMTTLSDAVAGKWPSVSTTAVLQALPADYSNNQKERAKEILNAIRKKKFNDGVLTLGIQEDLFISRINKNYDHGEFTVTNGPRNGISTVCWVKEAVVQEPVLFFYNDILEARKDFGLRFNTSFLNAAGTAAVAYVQQPRKALQSDEFKTRILSRFRPGENFLRKISAFIEADTANKAKPLMAYPRFPIPVYDYLKEISPDYIIPNISDIPDDTIAIMKPNQAFVESFLAGMNHEFSRELLWREFPTDMRGSYFRHFWEYDNDPANEMLPLPGETEKAFNQRVIAFQDAAVDVHELHKWKNVLGSNHKREIGLILLIKGELFRKYPDTMVYAQKAKFSSNPNNKLPRELTDYNHPENVKWPIITGMIEPNVHFFGFDITETVAKGNTTSQPGWFFVLRERPGQISFGLDDLDGNLVPPAAWEKLTWQHLINNANSTPPFLTIQGASFTPKKLENVEWGISSANTAYILYQNPVLYAKHASVFLKTE